MENINFVECLGYLASVLVAISFLMKSMNKLRFMNMVGGICFVIYAVAINAIPVALINLFTVCINVYYLTKKNTSKQAE
ncbi:YgjV family protein [Pelosinus sp. sgz500959]|uniref:YgjV family protein n=1 Tax=Pelosinus sp. sgz500959 TaxID=3242472 RepID=UPI00366C8145